MCISGKLSYTHSAKLSLVGLFTAIHNFIKLFFSCLYLFCPVYSQLCITQSTEADLGYSLLFHC